MPITARLSHKLHQTLGDEAAEDLVNWMQHVDAQRVELRELNELNFSRVDARLGEARHAAQADLAGLRQEMLAGFAALREELHGVDAKTQAGLAELRQALQAGLGGVETKLEQRTADLMKWSFVFWVGAVGAVAMLAGILR
jgi:hypothetical protein